MITYVIVVNDNGKLKTISQEELEEVESNNPDCSTETWIEKVLDKREQSNAKR